MKFQQEIWTSTRASLRTTWSSFSDRPRHQRRDPLPTVTIIRNGVRLNTLCWMFWNSIFNNIVSFRKMYTPQSVCRRCRAGSWPFCWRGITRFEPGISNFRNHHSFRNDFRIHLLALHVHEPPIYVQASGRRCSFHFGAFECNCLRNRRSLHRSRSRTPEVCFPARSRFCVSIKLIICELMYLFL